MTRADRLPRFANIILYFRHPVLVAIHAVQTRQLPDILTPRTLFEKFLWRKIFDRNPLFSDFSDKIRLKSIAAVRFPGTHCARLLWRGTNVDEAVRAAVSGAGYFKINNSSGANERLVAGEVEAARIRQLALRWFRHRHHRYLGEWAYKDIEPEVFIEEDLAAGATTPILDLNVYVFGTQISHFWVMSDNKSPNIKSALMDRDGRRLATPRLVERAIKFLPPVFTTETPITPLPRDFQLPFDAGRLCEHAVAIADGHDHLRIDFIWNGQDFYLVEITVYTHGGYPLYSDGEIAEKMSDLWDLRLSWFLSTAQTGWRGYYAQWLNRHLN